MGTERTESPVYQLFMLALSIFAIVAMAADTSLAITPESQTILQHADNIVCVLFLLDFLHSLRRAENRWRYLYTWGWLDLLSSIPAMDFGRWGRLARIGRILRILRGARAMRIIGQAILARRGESTFLAASLIVLLLIVLGSLAILEVERVPGSNIQTGEDAIWWAITTITTVGYGDRYPITTEGRMLAALLMCAGVGLFGTFSGLLASWFVAPDAGTEETEKAELRAELRQMREMLERMGRSAPIPDETGG